MQNLERTKMPEKTCEWYVTEDENLDIIPCHDDDGFCLVKDLYTHCYGKCSEYEKRTSETEAL